MTLRLVPGKGAGLVPAVTTPLASVLRRGRDAAVRRAGLRQAAPCWNAAEARTTVTVARADAVAGTSADARVLVATMVANVAHELADCRSGSLLGGHPATAAFDCASIASWLRRVSEDLDDCGASLYDDARVLAEATLSSPAADERVLADAWMAVCGLALLEEISAGPDLPDAEVRLIQRTVATTLVSLRIAPEARIARVTGVDRQTLAQWLLFGPPSPACRGHHISAPLCAALTGMTGPQWRALHAIGNVPEAVDYPRGTLTWDEADVLGWAASHSAEDCRRRCHEHQLPIRTVAVAGGRSHPRPHPQPQPQGGAAVPAPQLTVVR